MNAVQAPERAAPQAPSTIRRYREIATVLIAHGLADVVDALHLGRYVAWGTRALPGRARLDPSLSRAARLRLTLEELGPTFVKFGQALSIRADLLPDDLIAELAKLQDRAAPLDAGIAETTIESEFGEPIAALFASFDAVPFAAASMAQAHRAVLPTGEQVVVKVRRPGIAATIASDIEVLRQLARLVERALPGAQVVDPIGLVEEFARTIRLEQDLVREARNLERLAAPFERDATVRFPRVYWHRTTSTILTTEFLEGRTLSELDDRVGPFARRLIAVRGADAMLKQVLVHGFFHADPHPGNLLVLDGCVVGFLDFGIVGRLDEHLQRDLSRVIRAVWRRDPSDLAALALALTEPRGEVNRGALERDLAGLIEAYADVPLGSLPVSDVLRDVVAIAARHRLRFPSNLMLLIKALITTEAIGRRLDPSFRIVHHAAPLAERLWRRQHAPDALIARAGDTARQTWSAALALPGHLDAIGRKMRDGRLEVQFVHRNLEHFVTEMDRSSNRIAFAVVIAALIVGSSLIIQAGIGATAYGYPVLGLIGFLVAGLFGIRLAIGVVRSGRL
jgi:ubiquinone biosynthesis protein